MRVAELFSHFADYGISGLVIGAQLIFIMRQERRIDEANRRYQLECEARVHDAKAYTELALELHERVTKALGHLGDLLGAEANGAATYHEHED